MKTIQKICFCVVAVILFAANANAGRWLTRDPIEFMERDPKPTSVDANLYTFVDNNPINYIDPLGLLTVVVIGGPTSSNPFGHSSIGFTGNGIYSFGTGTAPGSSFTDFINNQASYRNSTLYVLDTTPQQEQNMINYLKQQSPKVNPYPDNCAARVNGALNSGEINIMTPDAYNIFGEEPVDNFPQDIATGLNASTFNLQIQIPKGTTLPGNFLTGFNPK
jgi:uncharacterized protein RhaS with RHS repeats